MKCYNLILNIKVLKINMGFYFMLSAFFLQIIFWIIYEIKGLKNIQYYMILFQTKDKKNNLLLSSQKNNDKSKYEERENNKDKIYIDRQEQKLNFNKNKFDNVNLNSEVKNIKNKNVIIKNFIQYGNIENINNEIINYNKYRKKSSIQKRIKELNNNHSIKEILSQKEILKNSNYNVLYKRKIMNKKIKNPKKIHYIKTSIKIENIENNISKKLFKISLTLINEDLEDIDYNQAIIFDKRNFCKMYFAFLVNSHIILETFCTNNYLNLFIIKLSFFIYTLQISFFLNSLFYTDDYISDAYYNNGILDFISGLPKSIYSSLVTLLTTNLLRKLSNNKNELKRLIKEKRNNKDYKNLINSNLKNLKYKLIAYFIIVIIFGLFFSYYVTSFCAVYRYSQKYLFYGFIESFVFDFIISNISCFIIVLLRYVSIKNKVKCLYTMSNIISIVL